MLINTKCFGQVDISEEMVITFDDGLMGFEEYKRFTILYNNEDGKKSDISWLQSMDEAKLAIPVVIPFCVVDEYNPTIEDELLKPLGELTDDNLIVLVALSVPRDISKMTANLKAPLIINSDTRKGSQIIVENQEYPIKYNAYEAIRNKKDEKGE